MWRMLFVVKEISSDYKTKKPVNSFLIKNVFNFYRCKLWIKYAYAIDKIPKLLN